MSGESSTAAVAQSEERRTSKPLMEVRVLPDAPISLCSSVQSDVLTQPAPAGRLSLVQLCILHVLFSPERKNAWSQFVGQAKYRQKNRSVITLKALQKRAANREHARQVQRDWRARRSAYTLAQAREWKAANPDVIKRNSQEWYARNREKTLAERKEWRDGNLEVARVQERRRHKNRYDTNTGFRLITLCRARLAGALKGQAVKSARTIELLGCSVENLKARLESQFRPPMSWENHGQVWEIDHIKACAKFDFTDPAQQRECFHFSNLQPLFKEENRAKAAK